MKASEKIKMYQDIENHGAKIINIFNLAADTGPLELCKKLHRIERKAHRFSTDYCNGVIDTDGWPDVIETILKSLDKILNFTAQGIPVFVNGDARGYALKIDSDYVRDNHLKIDRDMGGYGLIAPDFTPNN